METLEILVLVFSSNLLIVLVKSILDRRKNQAETEKLRSEIKEGEKLNRAEIEDKVFARASLLIDDQRTEIDASRSEINALNDRIAKLQVQHSEETDRLEAKISKLEKCVELYQEENVSLKGEVERLQNSVRGLH